jgi:hypothetical protein
VLKTTERTNSFASLDFRRWNSEIARMLCRLLRETVETATRLDAILRRAMMPRRSHRLLLPSSLVLGGLLLFGLFVRLVDLGAPLLEGAAAKQTHTAMVARNYYRDRTTWARPVVDDIGRPGYFLKEVPLVPGTVAVLYRVMGGVDERAGRLIGIASWLGAAVLLMSVLRRSASQGEALVGVGWFLTAPLGLVYSRAFMSDATMVAASLAALLLLLRWRELPSTSRACAAALSCGLAFALKPHAVFWLAPAGLILCRSAAHDGEVGRRNLGGLLLWMILGMLPAAAWYLHAASLHRTYPAAGAMVAEGWVAPRLLLDPALYREIGRQLVEMVFTPIGIVIALLGVFWRRANRPASEWALLAWGAGAIGQCLVFATRMFDERARGTEYYLLPLLPVAGLLIAQGCTTVGAWLDTGLPRARTAIVGGLLVTLVVSGISIARDADDVPPAYRSLLDRCDRIRALTSPNDELFVLSDRGGTVLYYCDRRGTALTLGNAVRQALAVETSRASDSEITKALQASRYIYIPFPELLDAREAFARDLEQDWHRVPGANDLWLFERNPSDLRRRR